MLETIIEQTETEQTEQTEQTESVTLSAFESLIESLKSKGQTIRETSRKESYTVAKDKKDETLFVVKAVGGKVGSEVIENVAIQRLQRFGVSQGFEMFGYKFVKNVSESDTLAELTEYYEMDVKQTASFIKLADFYLNELNGEVIAESLTDNEKFAVLNALCGQFAHIEVAKATAKTYDKAVTLAETKTRALRELAEKLKGESGETSTDETSTGESAK